MNEQNTESVRPVVALLTAGKPLPDIEFPWPDCPICGHVLDHDGEWYCGDCDVMWRSNGTSPEYHGALIDGSGGLGVSSD